jgi:hypothetical protein
MTSYWFRPKRYGYGATPITWQGWAVTIATVLVVVAVNSGLSLVARYSWALPAILAFDALAIVFLLVVTRRKTEGGWRWRWGNS